MGIVALGARVRLLLLRFRPICLWHILRNFVGATNHWMECVLVVATAPKVL